MPFGLNKKEIVEVEKKLAFYVSTNISIFYAVESFLVCCNRILTLYPARHLNFEIDE